MNTFLIIDTATPVCSVALSYNNDIIFSLCEEQPEGGHSARAGILVEQAIAVLREKGLKLSAVAVSAGPGSYTGLRIGSSLAKGLCHGFNVPLIAISTLSLMAEGYRQTKQSAQGANNPLKLVPMIDARRNEVYTATYTNEGDNIAPDRPVFLESHIPFADDMQDYEYHFFGNGATKCIGLWENFNYHIDGTFIPKAEYMLPLVEQLFQDGTFVDTAYWTPNYLKEYVATIAKNKVLG